MSIVTPARRRGFEYLDDPAVPAMLRERSLRDVVRSNAILGGAHALLVAVRRVLPASAGATTLLDVGTVAKIRDGSIKVCGAIGRFAADGVEFTQSGAERFDCVILATGFRPDLRKLLPDAEGVLDGQGRPLVTGRPTAERGLYFCGQIASPTGQLREIGLEARRIAEFAKDFARR